MEEPKKILIACCYPIFMERIGGMDYFFWELDKQLKSKNYQVSWLFQNGGNVSHYIEKELNFELIDKESDFTEGLFNWLKKNTDSAIFIGHFLDYQSTVSFNIKKELNIPCIYVDHMSRSSVRKTRMQKLKKIIKGILFYNHIDGIIAVSFQVKKTILNEIGFFWNKKVKVVHNGLQLEDYKIKKKKENHSNVISIFCIGHLIKEKGFQVAIEACKKLQENNIPFHLTIAGDGFFKKELLYIAKQQLPDETYDFIGNITNQAHWLNQSDIVIIPSLWKEAFGFTVVEAMLMKKIVFASHIGAIPEILGNTTLLFKPGHPGELFLLIKDYITNKEKYKPIATELFERAIGHFSLHKMVIEHIDFIEKQL
ncbi:MAG: glycosyltransferase family 4 protein [Flavobacterium sp.]